MSDISPAEQVAMLTALEEGERAEILEMLSLESRSSILCVISSVGGDDRDDFIIQAGVEGRWPLWALFTLMISITLTPPTLTLFEGERSSL